MGRQMQISAGVPPQTATKSAVHVWVILLMNIAENEKHLTSSSRSITQ
jgi:hypothetical protein